MRPFEWLAAASFAALLAAAPVTRAARRRQAVVMLGCGAAVLLVAATAASGSVWLRAWAPHAYLVLGYWLPALLVRARPDPSGFERWLCRSDDVLRPRLPAVSTRVMPLFELAYLVCYPLVPATFAIVWQQGRATDVDRFWVAVLGAGYACYGSLPWLVSRPPREAAPHAAAPAHRLASVNARVLGRVSHQLTTFPSGHVAVSCAAAASVMTVSAAAGTSAAVVALAIAVGAAAGRYHYVIDVVLGFVAAALALAAAAAFA